MSVPLTFTKLNIRRMAGVEGGLVLEGFSPGINIIYGPNGVGKSRTATAISVALWPRAEKQQRHWVVADWQLDGRTWTVEADGDAVSYRCQGQPADGLPLPSAEARDRYHLPLQELLVAEDQGFAQAIARESSGGYDLPAVVESLGFKDLAAHPPRGGRMVEQLREALADVSAGREKMEQLNRQEDDLDVLSRKKAAAAASAVVAMALEAAIALEKAEQALRQAREAVDSFPAAMARLAGNELGTLQQHGQQLERLKQQREEAERGRAAAQSQLAACKLDGELEATLVGTLTGQLQRLAELENLRLNAENAVVSAAAQRHRAAAAIGRQVDPHVLHKIDVSVVAELGRLAREAEKVRGELAAKQATEEWIGAAEPSGDPVALQDGVSLLHRWLRQPQAPPVAQRNSIAVELMLAGGVLAIVLGALLAMMVHRWLGLAGVVGVGLLAVARRMGNVPDAPAPDAREFIADEYRKLELTEPVAWDSVAVEVVCAGLQSQLAQARLEKEKADRFAHLASRREELERRREELAEAQRRMSGRLGLLKTATVTTGEESSLFMLVDNLVRWQAADAAYAAAVAGQEVLVAKQKQLASAVSVVLSGYGYQAEGLSSMPAALEDLRQRQDRYRQARQRLAAADSAIAAAQRSAADVNQRLSELFQSLGIVNEDQAVLRQLLQSRGDYLEAQKALTIATHQRNAAEAAIGQDRSLVGRPMEQLQQELLAAREAAAGLDKCSEQITRIRTAIELAKQACDLETALARRDDALAWLEQSRDGDYDCLGGWVLSQHLATSAGQRQQPAVFRRAREIFARITQGRYQLEFDPAGGGAFMAIDTVSGQWQRLEELSSGSRVQLLLAVRVAFVEQQEQGVKLPLIWDETLGNSDEVRAGAIIEAAIELAEGEPGGPGRQLFYFTAQGDEVAKWRDVLVARQTPHQLIDLAEVRGLAQSQRMPLRHSEAFCRAAAPSPAGLSRLEYGQLLKAPAMDPRQVHAGAVHLWHLVDELPLLHRLLEHGVQTWGQWRSLAEFGALAADGNERAAYHLAEARAEVLEHAARQWRVGRGKAVDRAVLVRSEVVSGRFIEQVTAVAVEEQGDAGKLLARLEEKAVGGFRQSTMAELRAFLEQEGYLDDRPVLSAEQLRTSVLALAMQGGKLDSRQIERLLAEIPWLATSGE